MKKLFTLTAITLFVVFGMSTIGFTASDNANSSSTLDIFKVKGIKKGLIKVNKNICYSGDPLEISIVLPQSLKAVWSGDAEVHLVIRMTNGAWVKQPPVFFDGTIPDQPKTFVSITLGSDIPEGDYQMAIILVNPGGDPLNLSDWYEGFSGLVSATTFRISAQCDDPEDLDCDGMTDDEDEADEE